MSHTVLEERTDFEYWNDKTTQTGARFLIGPGGRSYASMETYVRNGHEWNPSSWANRRYYHYDRLGSVSSASLDKPGLAGDNYDYSIFGMQIAGNTRYQWEDNGRQFMAFEHIGFTGQRTDYESGNIHFPFREYDPLSASWTTEDPIKDGHLWHSYVGQNPINFTDPLGLSALPSSPDWFSGTSEDWQYFLADQYQYDARTQQGMYDLQCVWDWNLYGFSNPEEYFSHVRDTMTEKELAQTLNALYDVEIVYLLRGHSSNESDNNYREAGETDLIALLAPDIKSAIQDAGFVVVSDSMSNYPNDSFDLVDRVMHLQANEDLYDIAISLHFNAPNGSVNPNSPNFSLSAQQTRGSLVIHPKHPSENPKSYRLAQSIHSMISNIPDINPMNSYWTQRPPVHAISSWDGLQAGEGYYTVLGYNSEWKPNGQSLLHNVPMVILEAGFYTNPSDRASFLNPHYRSAFSNLVANGVTQYFGGGN